MDQETNLTQLLESLFTLADGSLCMSKHRLIFRNNTIELNLMECANKEEFSFEDLKAPHNLETDSPTGKVA